uniref:Uncharacterized protein n=1 Tax=candidate division WOR-3 bacterium TaxID=2052148 RepID=A0A7C2K5L0_UNCW3
MLKKLWQVIVAIVLALMAIMFSVSTVTNIGCTVKTDTLFVHDTTNLGACFAAFINENYQAAFLFSDPMADLSSSDVKIRWGSNTHTFSRKGYGEGPAIQFSDTLLLSIGVTYTVSLFSNLGGCEGNCIIPDTCQITHPSDNDTLRLGWNVLVSWNRAQNANFYYIYYGFGAYDSAGYWIEYISGNTFALDTTCTIPASFFNVPGAAYYQGGVYVYPYYGPIPQAGATGNMQGFVKGFLYAEGEEGWVYFYVGTPYKKLSVMEFPKPTKKDAHKAILSRLGLR